MNYNYSVVPKIILHDYLPSFLTLLAWPRPMARLLTRVTIRLVNLSVDSTAIIIIKLKLIITRVAKQINHA